MGGIGALLAAAAEPRVAAVVAASAPADPYRLTRQTFRLARLPFPGPLAWPLAWLTTHVFLQPRGHTVRSVSAARAIETYTGPVLLIHGDADRVVPISHLGQARAQRPSARATEDPAAADVEVLDDPGRRAQLAVRVRGLPGRGRAVPQPKLGGPLDPAAAEALARATPATRLPQREHPFTAIDAEPGGMRTLDGRSSSGRKSHRAWGRGRGATTAPRRDPPHERLGRPPDQADGSPLRAAAACAGDLLRIVDAGRHAGSSKNKQRWDFVVVEDRERLQRLASVGRYAATSAAPPRPSLS